MNSQYDLEQRLQRLRGSGSAPDGLWARIEPQLHPPAAQPQPRRWPWAAGVAAGLLALVIVRQWPAETVQQAAILSPGTTVAAEVAALDQSQRGFSNTLPTMIRSGGPIPAVFIGPELQAVLQARQQVRMALEQQPDSTYLLRQLATLDHWQYRLLRKMGTAPGANV